MSVNMLWSKVKLTGLFHTVQENYCWTAPTWYVSIGDPVSWTLMTVRLSLIAIEGDVPESYLWLLPQVIVSWSASTFPTWHHNVSWFWDWWFSMTTNPLLLIAILGEIPLSYCLLGSQWIVELSTVPTWHHKQSCFSDLWFSTTFDPLASTAIWGSFPVSYLKLGPQ